MSQSVELESGETERWFHDSDGRAMFVREWAPAVGLPPALPVICVHGLTRNSRDFAPIAPQLAASGRRVLAVDVRGRGHSARALDPMRYRPDVYAGDLLGLFDQAGIDRAMLIGTSMGGLVTMILAALRPHAVAAAVLNDIGPEVAPAALERIASYTGVDAGARDWAEATAYARRLNESAFPHYTHADWAAFARRIFRENAHGAPVLDYDVDIAVPMRATRATLVPDLWPAFAALAHGRPCLLVRGATSDVLSTEVATRMRQRAPDMGYVEVPSVGHAPMLDEPAALAGVLDFLQRCA